MRPGSASTLSSACLPSKFTALLKACRCEWLIAYETCRTIFYRASHLLQSGSRRVRGGLSIMMVQTRSSSRPPVVPSIHRWAVLLLLVSLGQRTGEPFARIPSVCCTEALSALCPNTSPRYYGRHLHSSRTCSPPASPRKDRVRLQLARPHPGHQYITNGVSRALRRPFKSLSQLTLFHYLTRLVIGLTIGGVAGMVVRISFRVSTTTFVLRGTSERRTTNTWPCICSYSWR